MESEEKSDNKILSLMREIEQQNNELRSFMTTNQGYFAKEMRKQIEANFNKLFQLSSEDEQIEELTQHLIDEAKVELTEIIRTELNLSEEQKKMMDAITKIKQFLESAKKANREWNLSDVHEQISTIFFAAKKKISIEKAIKRVTEMLEKILEEFRKKIRK